VRAVGTVACRKVYTGAGTATRVCAVGTGFGREVYTVRGLFAVYTFCPETLPIAYTSIVGSSYRGRSLSRNDPRTDGTRVVYKLPFSPAVGLRAVAACETISRLVKKGFRYADCFSTSRMIQSHTSMGRCASCMASTRSQRCARSTRRHASESPSCRCCSHRSMRSALHPASARLLALMCFMASPVLRACAF
jgi:hypothetical protein